jgi:hypothetical protein
MQGRAFVDSLLPSTPDSVGAAYKALVFHMFLLKLFVRVFPCVREQRWQVLDIGSHHW